MHDSYINKGQPSWLSRSRCRSVKESSNGFVRRIIIDANVIFLYFLVEKRQYKWHLLSDKNRFDSHLLPTVEMSLKRSFLSQFVNDIVTCLGKATTNRHKTSNRLMQTLQQVHIWFLVYNYHRLPTNPHIKFNCVFFCR